MPILSIPQIGLANTARRALVKAINLELELHAADSTRLGCRQQIDGRPDLPERQVSNQQAAIAATAIEWPFLAEPRHWRLGQSNDG